MLRTIYLDGKLKQFSKEPVQVHGDTTQMIMQGLICMFGPRFKQMIRDGEWHVTRGKKINEVECYDDTISPEEVVFGLGKTEVLRICPAIKAKGAVARIIVGVVLVVVGAFTTVFSGGTSTVLVSMGIGLIFGGVSELLAPKPRAAAQDQSGQNASFLFNGTVNVTEQGGPVPIIYGRVPRASSLVLSAGISSNSLNVPGFWNGDRFKTKGI